MTAESRPDDLRLHEEELKGRLLEATTAEQFDRITGQLQEVRRRLTELT